VPRVKAKKLQSKKCARHRDKRRKHAAIETKLLYDDAPIGRYLVDEVAHELFLSGRVAISDESELVKLVREKRWFAAGYSLMTARNQFFNIPEGRRKTKRFFADLQVIRSRIDRNRDLDRIELFFASTNGRFGPPLRQRLGGKDEIDHLLTALQDAGDAVGDFLKRYKRKPERGGNSDELTRTFIDEIFEFWCDHYTAEASSDESRLFMRLLCAAWRDVGFPIEDKDGRRLEDWLADRVRKQFRDGVQNTRLSRQELRYPEPLDSEPPYPPKRHRVLDPDRPWPPERREPPDPDL
jgi:hypothetical protein